jgi:hypothetical protein
MADQRKRRSDHGAPRGYYAQLARAEGVTKTAIYLRENPDKRADHRARHECDAARLWSHKYLVRMDTAFRRAMTAAMAAGLEMQRGPAPLKTDLRVLQHVRVVPRHSGCSSPAALCAELGSAEQLW